jgi:SLT domain-containing protein
MVNNAIDVLNKGLDGIANFVNFFRDAINFVSSHLGAGNVLPNKFQIAHVAHYAEGTGFHPGGPAIVGERGPEMLWLPRGAQVAPNDITEMFLGMFQGGKLPGYADGIGDIGSKMLDWISGGAKAILDNVIGAFHLVAPSIPGMPDIASGMFNKVKDWALTFIDKILPKFDFSGSGGGGTPVSIPGNVQSWIAQAMVLTGAPASWAGALGTIAIHESGGNPNSINLWDSNALAGHPSQGLFQMIPSTFAAHMLSGHQNILNPVDNAASAIGYIRGRYGDVFHVPGIWNLAHGSAYVGYAQGGVLREPVIGAGLRTGTRYSFAENGPELITPYVPSGVNLAQSSQSSAPATTPSQSMQPIVLEIDRQVLGRILMPIVTNEIRNKLQVRI